MNFQETVAYAHASVSRAKDADVVNMAIDQVSNLLGFQDYVLANSMMDDEDRAYIRVDMYSMSGIYATPGRMLAFQKYFEAVGYESVKLVEDELIALFYIPPLKD